MNERLHRSRGDRIIAGVAGGLAEQLRVDPSLVRVVWAVLVPLTGGLALLAYIVMALVVPEEDRYATPPTWPTAPTTTGPELPAQPTGGSPGSDADAPNVGTAPSAAADLGTPPRSAPFAATEPGPTGPQVDRRGRDEGRAWSGSGRVAVGIILIAVGVWYLIREFVPGLDLGRFWPIALVAAGVLLLLFSTGRWSGGASDRDR